MTDRTRPPPRNAARLACGILALLALGSAARAEDGAFGDPDPRRVRPRREAPPLAVPGPPPPAIVSGYLPRNHNVPMYNEPPRRPPSW